MFMPTNDYHFITHWRVQGTCAEISKILSNAPDLARWWPSVYLEVKELEPGDQNGIGKVVELYTKGWLPYTLRWHFRTIENNMPYGFALETWGDFAGRGVWTFAQDGAWVDITYDWRVSAEKLVLRYFSFIMKPIFAANHRWAMRKGETSLQLELARRRATTAADLAGIPDPPAPTWYLR
jgi:hypothetical protein